MFANNVVIKSAGDVEIWIRAIVVSVRAGENVVHPNDCAVLVERFAAAGAGISLRDASGFWGAYSMSVGARWASLRVDCVAALDALANEIENGWCSVPNLRPLKGAISACGGSAPAGRRSRKSIF